MRRRRLLLAGLVVAGLLSSAALAKGERDGQTIVYFGTHGSGPAQGIFAATINLKSGELTPLGLAAAIERPTWQVASPDKPILYSVSETGNDGKSEASVYALSIDRVSGKLGILSKTSSGGGGATHIALDPRSKTLFVANYGTGTVAALPVDADGTLAALVAKQQDVGSGPSPRQKSAHAHSVTVDPSGHYLLAADLGADRIFVYRFDPATRQLTAAITPFLATPPGSGPRHAVFSPDGHIVYIDSELSGQITAYAWNALAGTLSPIQTLSAFPADQVGDRSAAEIAISHDGRFVYLSTRSDDSLEVYAVAPGTGMLSQIQRLPAGGKSPWSFGLSPDGHWLLVTDEASDMIAEFKVDRHSGKLSQTAQSLAIPKPVSVTFVP